MARNTRYPFTSAVVEKSKTVDDGFGGLKKADPITVIAALKFNAWTPGNDSRQRIILEYGLSEMTTVIRISCDYNAAFEAGLYLTWKSQEYRIVGKRDVYGGANQIVAISAVAEMV